MKKRLRLSFIAGSLIVFAVACSVPAFEVVGEGYPDLRQLSQDLPNEPLHPAFRAYSESALSASRAANRTATPQDIIDRPDLALFNVFLEGSLPLHSALSFIANHELLATHIAFDLGNGVGGEVAMLNAYDTSVDEVLELINLSIPDDISPAVATEVSTPLFRAVLTEDEYEHLGLLSAISSIESIALAELNNTESERESSERVANSGGAKFFTPGYHAVRITENGDNVKLRWEGEWSESEIDGPHTGSRPAFETDIIFRFKTNWLGSPNKGYIYPNPLKNAVSWSSNFPNKYLDTQALDGGKRSFTVGTTGAENFDADELYYSNITMPKWNQTGDWYRYYAYEIEHHKAHMIGCENDGWCVGTFYLSGKTTDEVFDFGAVAVAPSQAVFN
jgi:hypothetical protein